MKHLSLPSTALRLAWAVLLTPQLLACHRSSADEQVAAASSAHQAAPAPTGPDRLPPGSLLEGEEKVFGFPLPLGMKLEAYDEHGAVATGYVSIDDLAAYVKARVLASHVEMEGEKLVFSKVKLRGQSGPQKDFLYSFEIQPKMQKAALSIWVLAGSLAPQGLTEEQRWERAGYSPEGRLLKEKDLD